MSKKFDLMDFVFANNTANFKRYRNGYFFYEVAERHTMDVYEFQIPLDEATGITLLNVEKAMHLMRWIRQSIDGNTMSLIHSTKEDVRAPVPLKDK
jgi:hypothetical protein